VLVASQKATSLHWGDPPLAGSSGLRAVCTVRMAQSSLYFREGLGPGPYLALIILNNLSVCRVIYITYLNSLTSDTVNHEPESLDDAR